MTKERREELLRAGRMDDGDEFHCTAEVDPLDFETRSMPVLNWGELRDLLSQERTCSTCQHLEWYPIENYAGQSPECGHLHSAALNLAVEAIGCWGCLLWEQADPKEHV
jgi:hypothetical protein